MEKRKNGEINKAQLNHNVIRTLFIWMVSLYLGWERFSWVQVIGFVVMVLGTFIFNDVIKPPFFNGEEGPETSPLLREDENEQQ
jgi:hypothetical protein